jgi:hypothetical protein
VGSSATRPAIFIAWRCTRRQPGAALRHAPKHHGAGHPAAPEGAASAHYPRNSSANHPLYFIPIFTVCPLDVAAILAQEICRDRM